jgi:hypothetical protein
MREIIDLPEDEYIKAIEENPDLIPYFSRIVREDGVVKYLIELELLNNE